MDTLRGNLDTFGLEEIIGLIARSAKTGALRVFGHLPGRVFFVDGLVVYGTTRTEDGSVNDLRGRRTDVTIGDRRSSEPPLALPDLLRHQIVDVLVRLMERPGGEFVFDEGVTTTALPAGRTLSFDAKEVMAEVDTRIAEWREVRAIIPDPQVVYRLARELPPDQFEITLDARSWAFLSAVADGVSVDLLTERFRIFELAATRKLAEFVRRGLIEPAPSSVPAAESAPPEVTEPPSMDPVLEAAVDDADAIEGDAIAGEDVADGPEGDDADGRSLVFSIPTFDRRTPSFDGDGVPGADQDPELHDDVAAAEEPVAEQPVVEEPPVWPQSVEDVHGGDEGDEGDDPFDSDAPPEAHERPDSEWAANPWSGDHDDATHERVASAAQPSGEGLPTIPDTPGPPPAAESGF